MNLEFEKFIISQKAIIIRNNKCLILELSDKPGLWDVPGGRIHGKEDSLCAFRREVKEETGLENIATSDVFDYRIFYWNDKTKIVSVCALFFRINDKGQDDIILSEEHLQYKWIEKDEVKNYKFFWEFMPEVIKKGFKNLK